jgi:hypothetical protein
MKLEYSGQIFEKSSCINFHENSSSERCCALVIQHALRMRRTILSSVACPAVPCFYHITSQMARFSGGGGWLEEELSEYKMCVLIFSTTFVWKISQCEKD